MDAKITKLRLSRMLSYDWLKIVLTAVAMILVWLLVFSVTGTTIMPTQQFTVMNYLGNVSLSDGELYDINSDALKNGVYSADVIELTYVDLATNEEMAGSLLQARVAIEEGDVIFVADDYDYRKVTAEESTDEATGKTRYTYTYNETFLQTFLQGAFYQMYDVNVYLDEMRAYLGQYYADGDYKTPTELNEQKIKDDFNARTKKDKRYKKSGARAQGEKDEIARIEKYRDALVKFEWYLEQGVVALTETVVYEEYFTDGRDLKGTYSINMCPTLDKGGMEVDGKPAMSELVNAVAYKTLVEEETENAVNVLSHGEATASNMNVCLFNFDGVKNGFQYDSMCFIVDMIETYCHDDMLCHDYVYA